MQKHVQEEHFSLIIKPKNCQKLPLAGSQGRYSLNTKIPAVYRDPKIYTSREELQERWYVEREMHRGKTSGKFAEACS